MAGVRRVRRPALVISFPTTRAALACEALCEKRGLPGRTIPLPGQVSAGCGVAWKAEPRDRDALVAALADAGIEVSGTDVVELLEVVR